MSWWHKAALGLQMTDRCRVSIRKRRLMATRSNRNFGSGLSLSLHMVALTGIELAYVTYQVLLLVIKAIGGTPPPLWGVEKPRGPWREKSNKSPPPGGGGGGMVTKTMTKFPALIWLQLIVIVGYVMRCMTAVMRKGRFVILSYLLGIAGIISHSGGSMFPVFDASSSIQTEFDYVGCHISEKTMMIMFVVACIFVPIVLALYLWSYFRDVWFVWTRST